MHKVWGETDAACAHAHCRQGCKEVGEAAPCCLPGMLRVAVVSPGSRSCRSGFYIWFPKPSSASSSLSACSVYSVLITQHEITALLDFQLPFWMRGTSSAGLVGGPEYPDTQKESDLLEEIKPSPECASAGWLSSD